MTQPDPQIALATEFGLIYKQLYVVSFKDPNYPCNCPCHFPDSGILHCMPCCYDWSFGPKILRYDGVYRMNKSMLDQYNMRLQNFTPEVQIYFLFTEEDGHERLIWHNGSLHMRHPAMLGDCTITLHRGAFQSKLKKRHNPKDIPIDCAAIYAGFGEACEQCGKKGLRYEETKWGSRLFDNGEVHRCKHE